MLAKRGFGLRSHHEFRDLNDRVHRLDVEMYSDRAILSRSITTDGFQGLIFQGNEKRFMHES